MRLADKNNLRSIAFPAISAGIFGFPVDRCARIMLSTTIEYLNGETRLERVIFCLYGKKSFEVFQRELKTQLPD